MESAAAEPLPWNEAHRPYGIAVIDAVALAGLEVMTHDYGHEEDRYLHFGLADALNRDELVVSWHEDLGWTWKTYAQFEHPQGEPTGHGSLPVPPLAEPDAVAAALRELLGLRAAQIEASWTPPPGYNPNTPPPFRNADTHERAFESALAAYLTHPAWLEETAAAQ